MSSKKIPTVAIIGRTNVGKSTLFNALLGRRVSIVEDIPGVTRDRHYGLSTRFGYPFTVIDTGGLLGEEGSGLEDQVRKQAQLAIDESDLILAVYDGHSGLHPHDEEVASILRRANKPTLHVINKCEKPAVGIIANEFYALGIEDLHFVSAAHNVGIGDLVEEVVEALQIKEADETDEKNELPIKLAFVGKPNAGKSSIINRILGEERLVTSPISGTTRDSIDIFFTREGQEYQIVDTAGLRKKANVDEKSVERYSNLHALTSLSSCDVAVLVIDGSEGLTDQDIKIAGLIHERGRGFVIVVNKWDLVEKDHKTVKAYTDGIYEVFKFARYAPIVFVSAISGRRCPSIIDKAREVYGNWSHRITTAKLNKVLNDAFTSKPPPVYRGEPVKMFFATQASSCPPEIVIFVNYPDKLGFSYERYIRNQIREHFPFEGTDIKIVFKKKKRDS